MSYLDDLGCFWVNYCRTITSFTLFLASGGVSKRSSFFPKEIPGLVGGHNTSLNCTSPSSSRTPLSDDVSKSSFPTSSTFFSAELNPERKAFTSSNENHFEVICQKNNKHYLSCWENNLPRRYILMKRRKMINMDVLI